jgi:thermopsin
MNNVGRSLVGLAAIALALLVVLSFDVTAAGQAPPYATFPPIHGKHVAKDAYVNPYNSYTSGAYVNPYNSYTSPPAPTGIADYGLYNYSSTGGPIIPYTIMTDEVLGYANITSLLAYYQQAMEYGVSPYSATLQLNVVLQVNTTNGTYAYWLQDVASFQTNESQVTFIDNIWNLTGSGSMLSSSAVSGNGTVASAGQGNTFYYDVGPTYTYSFPFAFVLVINVSYTPNATYIWFGFEILQNGTPVSSPQYYYYDEVEISQPGIVSAAIYITGNNYTPNGLYYDAELVWGGGGNGAPTQFVYLNSTLGLYYVNSSGNLTPMPSLYTFGSDTAESAYNVNDSLVNGVPNADAGNEWLGVLTNDFNVYLISG